jgi:hypothetical protein
MSHQTNISLAVAAIVGISSVALISPDAMAARNRADITRAGAVHGSAYHGGLTARRSIYRGAYPRPGWGVGAAAAGAAVAPNYGYGYGNNYGYGNYYRGYWGPPPVGAPVAQNYNYGYGNYGYPGYFGPTTSENAAAQDARLAQNPAALRALRRNYSRER